MSHSFLFSPHVLLLILVIALVSLLRSRDSQRRSTRTVLCIISCKLNATYHHDLCFALTFPSFLTSDGTRRSQHKTSSSWSKTSTTRSLCSTTTSCYVNDMPRMSIMTIEGTLPMFKPVPLDYILYLRDLGPLALHAETRLPIPFKYADNSSLPIGTSSLCVE